MPIHDYLFKVIICGDGGVGKTTLLNRYVSGLFNEDSKMTIGVDFRMKQLKVNEKIVTLQIWDFAGEERFRFLLPHYLTGASGGIFMYDITRYSSLKNLYDWIKIIRNGIEKVEDQIPILMVGGKADLKENRSIEYIDAYELAKSFDLSGYLECSSKTGENVEKIFHSITISMLEKVGFLEPIFEIVPI